MDAQEAQRLAGRVADLAEQSRGRLRAPLALMADGAWTGGVSGAFTAEMQAQARALQGALEAAVRSTQAFAGQVRAAEDVAAQRAADRLTGPR